MPTWYVDFENGNDSNDGLSLETAKLTVGDGFKTAMEASNDFLFLDMNPSGFTGALITTDPSYWAGKE